MPEPRATDARAPGAARAAAWLLCAALAGGILLFFVILYPLRGFRVPMGSDTPVYVWWARYAGVAGLGPLGTGSRPGVVGLLATLATVTRAPMGGVTSALPPVLAASTALAVGALLDLALGANRLRFALTAILTGTFLTLMAQGYLSTLTFGVLLVASVAAMAEGVGAAGWAPVIAAAGLLGTAGMAHDQFLALAAVVLGGASMALVGSWRRDRRQGIPSSATALGRVVVASAAGASLAGVGLLAGRVGAGPAPDTSRDALLRRSGLHHLLTASYRRKLRHDFPWYRWLILIGAALLPAFVSDPSPPAPPTPAAADRRRLLLGAGVGWLIVTAGALALLRIGVAAPGQRLIAFCLPLPALAAIGLTRVHDQMGPRRPRAAAAVVVAATVVYAGVAWLTWGSQDELVEPAALAQSRAAGAFLGTRLPGTPMILVADDPGDKPSLFVVRYGNYLRGEVPAARVPDVHPFVGGPADLIAGSPAHTGLPEHDHLADLYGRDVRAVLDRRPVAVAIEGFDPTAYRRTLRLPGAIRVAPGVAVVPGFEGTASGRSLPSELSQPGSGPQSPWLPVWLAPALLILLFATGWGWADAALPAAGPLVRVALAPAFGVGSLILASVAVDAAGVRLSGWGAFAALVLALGGGLILRALRPHAPADGAPAGSSAGVAPASAGVGAGTGGSNEAGSVK